MFPGNLVANSGQQNAKIVHQEQLRQSITDKFVLWCLIFCRSLVRDICAISSPNSAVELDLGSVLLHMHEFVHMDRSWIGISDEKGVPTRFIIGSISRWEM